MSSDVLERLRLTVHETARAALFCFECEKLTSFDDGGTNVVPLALWGQPPLCTTCGAAIDVWKNSVLALSAVDKGGLAMAAQVGARHTAILYRLCVGEVASFDIRDKDVPADAQLLRITHRAALADGAAIVDLDATDSARRPGFLVRVLGVRLDGEATDMQAQTTVTWARHDADDEGRRSLNRALLALADGRLDDAIVPANVAVEVTLARVLSEHLGRVGIARDRQRDFMTTAATYSHQLNVLLPMALHERGAPGMPDHIRGILNRLRDLRNDVGHRGTSRTTLTREVVGECLAAAVFGFHYVRLADQILARREATR
jgi:hypothetical protein